jgi:hypothetical protein
MVRTPLNKISIIMAWIFLVLGFVAYVTNPVVGSASFFDTNHFQNFMHVFTGVVFLIAGFKSERIAAITLTFVGVIYLLLAVLGFTLISGRVVGLLENNLAIEVLYLVLAVILIGFGRLTMFRV